MPFAQLGLHPDLVRAVKAMNFEKPTPIQEAAIPSALAGRDVLGCAQTGGGKTAAFALPVLHHLLKKEGTGIRALVLTPTRELAAQVETTFRDVGRFTHFKTAVVIGGVGFTPQVQAASRAQVVVATPGRLLDHLKQGSFRLDRVEQLVLDEADRMLDMGFLPDIRAVIDRLPKDRQTQLFSATLAPEVERIASFTLKDPTRVEISKPTTVAEGISQVLYPVVQSQKPGLLLHLLKATEMQSVLVFSRTKHGADKLAKKLADAGHTVGVLHGNRSQNQRTQAMEGFRRGRIKMLVATDIAARGIDVKGISHVVNYDVPRFPEDYVHRVGRTARAYGVGDAITFMDPSLESGFVRDIERFVGITFPRAVMPDFQYNNPPREEKRPQGPQHQGRREHRHGRPDNRRQDRPQQPSRDGGRGRDQGRNDGRRRDGRPGENRFRNDKSRGAPGRDRNRGQTPQGGGWDRGFLRNDGPDAKPRPEPHRDERRDRPQGPSHRDFDNRYRPPTRDPKPRGFF
jgi:ATP-dependent RNA helicase RhlE